MKFRSIYILFVFAQGLCLLGANAAPALTVALSAGSEESLTVFDDVAVTRKAVVAEVDVKALTTTQPAVNDTLIYRFFDDTAYTVTVSSVSSGYAGAQIVEGHALNSSDILFRSVITGEGIRYEINDKQRGFIYQAVSLSNGSLQITEYNKEKGEAIIPTEPLTVPGETLDTSFNFGILSADTIGVTPLSTSEIDVMLVFDQTAQTWAGANGGVTAFANAVISKMNTAHALSGTECSFRLIHVYLSSHTYNTSTEDLGTVLSDLYYEDGGVSEVSDLRDSIGADLVAMMVDTGSAYGTTGIGYLPGSSSGSSRAAFSVNSIRSVNISHTMTHEIGHNLGCGHSKDQASGPGPGIFSYAAGWYFTGANGTKYHTIMSYNNDGYGNYYQPCELFSSPLLSFQSRVPGDAADGDNARCIRNMKSVIAGYRTSSVNMVSDPVITPATGSSFTGSLAVSMSCSTAGAEIRYTTDGSDPTATSTLYTLPVTITASTTFKVKAFKDGMDSSGIIIAGYSLIAANDYFVDATEISETANSVAGNNIDCSKESGEPSHYYTANASAWWKWTAPKSGIVTFSTYGSGFDTMMAGYTGSSIASLTKLDSNDDSGGTYQSEISFPVTAGGVYFIAVDGYGGAEGSISLNWDLEYLEVFSSSIIEESGIKALRMNFSVRSGQSYTVKRKDSLSASDPWYDFSPPLTFTAGADGPYQVDIEIPEEGGRAFFKIIKQ